MTKKSSDWKNLVAQTYVTKKIPLIKKMSMLELTNKINASG
jgi:hypothetical protein